VREKGNMEYIAIVILGAAVTAFIGSPLFGRQKKLYHLEDAFEFTDTNQLNYLTSRKARIEENMRELEFEFQMGKLSGDDYAALKNDYTSEMEGVAKAMERFQTRQEIGDLIENEVRSKRRIK
jgi:hypothetical protein